MSELRIVSLVEGKSLTGPIKPLLNFARHVADATSSRKVHQAIITTARPGGSEASSNEFVDAARLQGTEIAVVSERHALDTSIVPRIMAIIDRHRPHIVETHSFKPHFVMALIRRRLQHPDALRWVAFHHGYTAESARVRLYNQFDRWSLRKADRVVTLCNPFAEHLVRHRGVARERISLIKNAIENRSPAAGAEVARLRTELGIAGNEQVILAVGRLSREKGHADLIRAFAALVQKCPGIPLRLVIVGDGVERQRLTALSQPLGSRVIFAGQRQDVWDFYGLASIFVLPSHSEGSPMVLLEAMMAGRPVIATAVGGIPETVTDRYSALLVPPRSPVLLGAAMQELLLHTATAEAIAAAATSELGRFTIEKYCNSLLAIYDTSLARPA